MFDEITSHPNLQHALTDLHVSEPGSNSNGRSIHFKVDTGACGNLSVNQSTSTNRLQEIRQRLTFYEAPLITL